jgi:hypothetical protein
LLGGAEAATAASTLPSAAGLETYFLEMRVYWRVGQVGEAEAPAASSTASSGARPLAAMARWMCARRRGWARLSWARLHR